MHAILSLQALDAAADSEVDCTTDPTTGRTNSDISVTCEGNSCISIGCGGAM